MAHKRRSPAPVGTPAAGQQKGSTTGTHNTPRIAQPQRLRHFNQPLADVLVQAAIQSGHLKRLKVALREGRFDG